MEIACNIDSIQKNGKFIVAAFYKFARFPKCDKVQKKLKNFMIEHDVKGTVLVSIEGINGTISGLRGDIDATLEFIKAIPGFEDLEHKESYYDEHPFGKTKVKLKKEIIGLGVPANPAEQVGTYVEAGDWNKILEMGIPVIDTRNSYEVNLGTFEGATDPKTNRFKELPEWTKENIDPAKHKKVAMFCTGGIRCEKYSAQLLDIGVEEVFHLKGGILKYLETVPKEQSKWHGECYVFDERVAVGHGLTPSEEAGICPNCGHSIWTKDRIKPEYIHGERCSFCPSK